MSHYSLNYRCKKTFISTFATLLKQIVIDNVAAKHIFIGKYIFPWVMGHFHTRKENIMGLPESVHYIVIVIFASVIQYPSVHFDMH